MPRIFICATLIVAGVIAVILPGCEEKNKQVEGREKYVIPDSLMKIISVDTALIGDKLSAVSLTGMVDFNQEKQVNIFPLVSGNIEDIKVELGDYVKTGQVLAVVRSSEMAGYTNNLTDAESNLTVAKNNLAAQKALFNNGLSSQIDLTNAQANYDQAEAQLQMAKRVLKVNGNNTNGDYIVKAPISGFIVQKNVTNNTAIRTDNSNSMFVISNLDNVWVQANVYESNIGQVHLGDDVNITTISYPGRIFKGKVDKMMNVLDPTNKVMKVKIVIPNTDYALKPQMFATVNVISKQNEKSLWIPSSAVTFDHSQHFVLLYNSPSDVRITKVEISGSINNKTYISSDLKEGDRVITKDVLLIYDALNN